VFLSENSRPAWLLSSLKTGAGGPVWTPTVEHMLEDGLCLIAAAVIKDQGLLRLLPDDIGRIGMDDIDENTRTAMYARLQKVVWGMKMIVTVFHGSSITHQLGILSDMPFDLEVCTPQYHRQNSQWSGRIECEGNL
jgi:hypothetical protein